MPYSWFQDGAQVLFENGAGIVNHILPGSARTVADQVQSQAGDGTVDVSLRPQAHVRGGAIAAPGTKIAGSRAVLVLRITSNKSLLSVIGTGICEEASRMLISSRVLSR